MRERCRNWIRTPSLRGQLIWLSVSSVLVTLLISLLILVLLISNVMGPFVNREAEFAMQTVSQSLSTKTQLLEDILKRLRPIADKRNIDLILDSFRPVEADVDELKFTSAISNLVENAIKYNVDDGWVRVSLDADHKFFYVTVADSGMGIPEDSLSRIFERFYRVDKSHSREIGGTGLGLAITRSTIGMHHGVIKVFSKEGEGTTFSVRVPLSYIP